MVSQTTPKLDRLIHKVDDLGSIHVQRLDDKIDALGSIQVRRLDDISEVQAYVRGRMAVAHDIQDLTWGPLINRISPVHAEAYRHYRDDVIRYSSRQDVRYREVMTFPDIERVKAAQAMLQRHLPAYQLKYYDLPAREVPPLIRFVLLDDEVVFVHHREPGLPEEGVAWLSVKHPQIVQMARVYYAEVWNAARSADPIELGRIRAQMEGAAG
jgi:hypothetical protein